MSKPVLSGESLQVDVTDGVLRIANDPGFTSENGDGCPYRAVWLSSTAAGTVFGYAPSAREPVDKRWPGYFDSRASLALWSIALPPSSYLLRVYAGSLYKGWGDAPGDWIEWSADDHGKNPSGVPRVNEVTFTVEAPNTPPPEPPPIPADRRLELDPRLPEIRDNTQIHFDQARATFIRWVGANPKEYAAILELLGDIADNTVTSVPSLKTHKGRALVGVLQAGAATVGRLP